MKQQNTYIPSGILALILLVVCSLVLLPYESSSQNKKKNKTTYDTIDTFSKSDLFSFPNINKVHYYVNAGKMRELRNLERREKWEELYPRLREYVMNFGIANFYKDTYWLWRLAKLTEIYGNKDEALLLYKLVLKHHRADLDISKIMADYDSLAQNDQDYYADLDYYYDLINYKSEVDTLAPLQGTRVNMGDLINSDVDDYGPALNASNNILIFTSRRNAIMQELEMVPNEDLFFTKQLGGYWDAAKPLEGVNTEYNEGSACISKDGKTLFFSRCDAPDGYGDCDIYIAEMQSDSSWGEIQNLGVLVNSKAWDSHPSLTHSEDTLFFASDRIGGFGMVDIYFTYKDSKDNWSKAHNAGPIINTRSSEVSPFYHHVHDVLYFSSNGHNLNFGQYDIYKSYWNGNNWGEPKNIGPIVNGEGSEYYFTIDSRSNNLYYARAGHERDKDFDLYSFPLPMGAQPGALATVQGSIYDEMQEEKPDPGIVSIIDLDKGVEVAPKLTRPDGSYSFDLINNRNYLMVIKGENFLNIEELFYLEGDMEMNPKPTPVSTKIKFNSITFDKGEAELKSPMYSDLDKVKEFMATNPKFKLKISGHTDKGGKEEFNIELSQKRADIIKEYIVYFGNIDPSRVEAIGYGSSKPIVDEKTEEDKELNRRVEFQLIRQSQVN